MRWLIPTVATCGALAVGIALGAGPLDSATHAASTTTTTADTAARQQAAYGEKWASAATAPLVANRLAGRHVAVITLPGADAADVKDLETAIAAAQGTVSASVAAGAALLDQSQRTMVGDLAATFAKKSRGAVDTGLAPYAQLGAILGLAVAGPGETASTMTTVTRKHHRSVVHHEPAPVSRTTAQETLTAGKLATVTGGKQPASLVLVVLGGHVDADALHDLLAGLAGTVHVVVAAPTGDADLASVRNHSILTVDGIETPYGRAAAVLGLVRQITAKGGSFGASGADGLLPPAN